MYVSEYAVRRRGRLGAVPLINQGGGAYNTPTPGGASITSNPLVYSNPYTGAAAAAVSVAKQLGVKIDLKSPSAHIKERSATIAALAARAMNGDDNAWAQVWSISSRPLPVRLVDDVPRDEGKDCKPGGCQTSGKAFPCAAGCTKNPFHGAPRVGDVAEQALHEIEAARGAPTPGNTTQGQSSGSFPPLPGAAQIKAALGDLGGAPVLATLGFLAVAFLVKGR